MAGQVDEGEEIRRVGIAQRLAMLEFDSRPVAPPGRGELGRRKQRVGFGEGGFRRDLLAAQGAQRAGDLAQGAEKTALGGNQRQQPQQQRRAEDAQGDPDSQRAPGEQGDRRQDEVGETIHRLVPVVRSLSIKAPEKPPRRERRGGGGSAGAGPAESIEIRRP